MARYHLIAYPEQRRVDHAFVTKQHARNYAQKNLTSPGVERVGMIDGMGMGIEYTAGRDLNGRWVWREDVSGWEA